MKKIALMSVMASALLFASGCDSSQKTNESAELNTTEERDGALGEDETATNEAPATYDMGSDANAADHEMMGTGENMTAAQFAKDAASGGMMEVELGRMASQKAQSQQVKDFGQMMVNDHSKANQKLKSIVANKQNITLPTKMMDKHQEHVDKLSKLSGSEFDREYMSMMVKDHKEDVNKFQKASQNVDDNEIKTFASTTLPTLQMHLDKAQQVHSSMEGSASTSRK